MSDEIAERHRHFSQLRAELGVLEAWQLAGALEVTVDTLATWRGEGKGPDYVKLGKGVFYRFEDVKAWVAHSRVTPDYQNAHTTEVKALA